MALPTSATLHHFAGIKFKNMKASEAGSGVIRFQGKIEIRKQASKPQ
jgi:hypothetical protein